MQWLEIKPLDTLFFRGGEPMVAGETHEAGTLLFPPRPETIIGALRTAILAQHGINPRRVLQLEEDADLDSERLPFWGSPKRSGFWIGGPLLKICKVVLFPAPANWFYTSKEDTLLVKEARVVPENLPVKASTSRLLWLKRPEPAMEQLAGAFWVTRAALEKEEEFKLLCPKSLDELSNDKPQAVSKNMLFVIEERIGIAKDFLSRTVKTGHLYAARHVRLKEEVALLIRVDKPLCPTHLKKEGVFQLGGESRMVRYRFLDETEEVKLPKTRKGRFLAISHLGYERAKDAGLFNKPYASTKPLRIAGWDMRRGFHKSVKNYFPAGTVFFDSKNPGLCELIPF